MQNAGRAAAAWLAVMLLLVSCGGAAPTATPSPTATVAAPVALFLALAGDPSLAFHEESVATVRDGADSATVTVSMDQSGPDAAIAVSVQSTLASVRAVTQQTVIKDGVNYLKDGDAAWTITGSASVSSPFASMRADQIEYVGREMHEGELLNHLRVSLDTAGGVMDCQLPDVTVADLWVGDDGVPATESYGLPCPMVRGIGGTTSYVDDFTRVGQPITIEVPAQFR